MLRGIGPHGAGAVAGAARSVSRCLSPFHGVGPDSGSSSQPRAVTPPYSPDGCRGLASPPPVFPRRRRERPRRDAPPWRPCRRTIPTAHHRPGVAAQRAGPATPYSSPDRPGRRPRTPVHHGHAANLGAFVQATTLNPRTGALSVYNPLVITQGTTPAVAPVCRSCPGTDRHDPLRVQRHEPDPGGRDAQRATPGPLVTAGICSGSSCSAMASTSSTRLPLIREGGCAAVQGTSARIVPTAAGSVRAGTPKVRDFDMVARTRATT